jgi:hypothetical protein
MPTFGAWEAEVLELVYDQVDYVSAHAYYEPVDGDPYLTAHQANAAGQPADDWPTAPHLLEDTYSVIDAVVVGGLLISLLRHSDRVTIACQAQLANAIAPIRTEPGGPAWRQTIFHPFALTSRLARGTVLRVALDAPAYGTTKFARSRSSTRWPPTTRQPARSPSSWSTATRRHRWRCRCPVRVRGRPDRARVLDAVRPGPARDELGHEPGPGGPTPDGGRRGARRHPDRHPAPGLLDGHPPVLNSTRISV